MIKDFLKFMKEKVIIRMMPVIIGYYGIQIFIRLSQDHPYTFENWIAWFIAGAIVFSGMSLIISISAYFFIKIKDKKIEKLAKKNFNDRVEKSQWN